MSLPRHMRRVKDQDLELQKKLGIVPQDKTQEQFGVPVYSLDDIRQLEEAKAPWLARKRRQRI